MSRAFVKEDTDDLAPLPDLPQSPHPNYVTPRGLSTLQARLLATQTTLAALRTRADRLDKLPEAAAERDIRYLEARLRAAVLIDPALMPLTEVAFGQCITVADANGVLSRFEITGEDESDATLGRIAPHSPLARALLGAQVGDLVTWRKPSGEVVLEIMAICQADPQP